MADEPIDEGPRLPWAVGVRPALDSLSVRELIAELILIEDAIRGWPLTQQTTQDKLCEGHVEQATFRQRQLVRELRRRRPAARGSW